MSDRQIKFLRYGIVFVCYALALLILFHFEPPLHALNQTGVLSREEPYSFWTTATPASTAQYGLLAQKQPVDAVVCLTTGNLVIVDQNNVTITLTAVTANTVFTISPSRIDSSSTGTYAVLYK